MNKVLLVNRDLGHNAGPTLVQGWHGELIGVSKFNSQLSCHTLEISAERYDEVAESLSKAVHIAMRRWEPRLIEEPLPVAVAAFFGGYTLGMEGHPIPEDASELLRAGYLEARKQEYNPGLDTPESTVRTDEEIAAIFWMEHSTLADDKGFENETRSYSKESLAELVTKYRETFIQGENIFSIEGLDDGLKRQEQPADDLNVPFFSLRKIATTEGVDIKSCKGEAAIRAAIIAKRSLTPA